MTTGPSTKLDLQRLPKRLLYVLRYGAVKEGLEVDNNGYVDVKQLPTIHLLKDYTEKELLNEIQTSVSLRNKNRYEWRTRDGVTYVRATYLRNFEPNPYHERTGVKTLFETSLSYILDNLDLYDLEDFQEEYIIRLMLRRLVQRKAVTNKKLSALFVPALTRISLEGVYLTNNVLRMLWTQCPNLKQASLKNCGYIITDTVLANFVKKLPKLEHLNVTNCRHLTDKSLASLSKNLPVLQILIIARVPLISPKAVHKFLQTANELTVLDVYYMKTTRAEYKELTDCADERGVELVLRKPRGEAEESENGSDSFSCSDEDEDDNSNNAEAKGGNG